MIRNSKTGTNYRNLTEAAADIGVSITEIKQHLEGKIRNVRGCRLRVYDPPRKKRKYTSRPDLRIEIRCTMTGARYTSIKQAAKVAGVSYSMMYRHLYKCKPRYVSGMVYTFAPPKRDYVRRVVTNDLFGRID